MANRHRKATAGEKPDPNTVASVETGNVLDTDPTEDTGGGYAGASGSSFAHLVEDTPSSRLVADWDLAFGDPPTLELDAAEGVIYFGAGTAEPIVGLGIDATNSGPRSIGVYSETTGIIVNYNIYGGSLRRDGSGNGWVASDGVGDNGVWFYHYDWNGRTADSFTVSTVPTHGAKVEMEQDAAGPATDLALRVWRASSGVNSFTVDYAGAIGFAAYIEGGEIADPAAPAANKGRLYFKDVGGKTALVARFPTGAVQQIAIEP